MAKKKRRVKNKKKVKPISLLSKLNRLRDGSFESDKTPSIVGVSEANEFSKLDNSILPSGIPYHIFFDGVLKTENYFTGLNFTDESEAIIRIKGESSFGQYKRLKGKLETQSYLTPYVFKPQKKDFKRGFAYRFFARKRFGDKKLLEISETDYKKNSIMYTTCETRWNVGDNKFEMQSKNPTYVEDLIKKGFEELENLNIMEGYIGTEDDAISLTSLKELRAKTYATKVNRKRSRSRKGRKKRNRGNQTTQTTTSPSNSGGNNAY